MFIGKILQSDWLDYRTWTISTFHYRRSRPLMQPLVAVKTQAFRENGKDAIGRGSLEVRYVQKLWNFRELFGKTKDNRLLHFRTVLRQCTFSMNIKLSENIQRMFKRT